MRIPKPIVLFFLIPALVSAQRPLSKKDWFVAFSPAILPSPVYRSIGIQPGIGYQATDRISILTQLSFPVGKRNNPDSSFYDKRYFRIMEEIRYFFFDGKKGGNIYIGFQSSYSKRNFMSRDNYYYQPHTDSVTRFDQAKVKSPILTLSVQFGAIVKLSKTFMLDCLLGWGARMTNTRFTDVLNPGQSQILVGEGLKPVPASYHYPGVHGRIHFDAAIRLVYVFHHQ